MTGGVGGELRRVHRLHLGGRDAEGAGEVDAQAVGEGVFARRQPLEEEVGAAVADLLVDGQDVPLPPRAQALGLAAGGAVLLLFVFVVANVATVGGLLEIYARTRGNQ